jgi:opacity protein-like surface antigen/outer membrane protease
MQLFREIREHELGHVSSAARRAILGGSTRTLVLAAGCLLALAPAKAADLPSAWNSDLSPEPVYRWNGLYGGVHLGGMTATNKFNLIGFPDTGWIGIPPATSANSRGWLAGGQYGYNHQIGVMVFGFEQDIMLGTPAATTNAGGFVTATYPSAFAQTQKIDWLSTLRGRVGATADDRTLIYATGGVALAGITTTTSLSFPGFTTAFTGASSDLRVGWTAGVGLEYALTAELSAKLEYLYFDVGGSAVVAQANESTSLETHDRAQLAGQIVRVGVNYRFDPGGSAQNAAASADHFSAPSYADDDLQVELGVRSWFSTGKTAKNLYDPTGAELVSRLTYSGIAGYSGETFLRVDHRTGFFAKGYVGLSQVGSGKLKDEDFPPGISPYSSTDSAQQDGSLLYVTGDVGYDVLRTAAYKLGPFVGYYQGQQVLNAYGCTQTATNPSVCSPSIPSGTLGITENERWQALRVGLNGELAFLERFRVNLDGAWLPYAWMQGTDTHWLRIQNLADNFTGPIPEDGHGSGMQFEGVLSYLIDDAFSVGIGARYWYVDARGTSHFEGHIVDASASPQPTTFVSERYGGFLQGAYRF